MYNFTTGTVFHFPGRVAVLLARGKLIVENGESPIAYASRANNTAFYAG